MRGLTKTPALPDRLVDEYLEGWVSWRDACQDVQAAYELWSCALASRRSLAFETYRAALDREESAASVVAACASRLHDQR